MKSEYRPPLSPRAAILAGLAPESLVAGYSKPERRWVTVGEAAASQEGSPAPDWLPQLDGVMVTGDAPGTSSRDYGGMVSRRSGALLRPGSTDDIARFVSFAAKHGVLVAPRGQSHTLWGQSQVEGGVQIDLRTCDRVGPVEGGTVEVEAGAEWRSVLQVTLSHGYTPPVLTDYQRLTVGGTLSVGGVGGTSWRYGAQVDNVEAVTVVTGEGQEVRCSESDNTDLFEAVLAGQGQCGIITSARLRLVPAPDSVRVFELPYPDLKTAMEDLETAVGEGRFDYMVIFIVPGPGGWISLLQGLKWLREGETADDHGLIDGLRLIPGAQQVYSQSFFGFSDRVLVQIGDLAAVDLAEREHPWIDLFLGGSVAHGFVEEVLAGLTPDALGRSFPILLYPFRKEVLTRPMFRVPDEPYLLLFDILRAATPGAIDPAEMVRHNRELLLKNQKLGGTHYPISAVDVTPEDWRAYYGPVWPQLQDAKRRFDPKRLLTPGPRIFAD